MRSNKLLYVAGAYTGNVEENIMRAEQVSVNLIRGGFHVFTPHKNSSGYEKYEDDNLTYDTWIEMDLDILTRCDAMYVINNSSKSEGVKKEIELAERLGIPIIHEIVFPSNEFTLDVYYREVFIGR